MRWLSSIRPGRRALRCWYSPQPKRPLPQKISPIAYGLHDTGAATAHLALQATADGLHTHSMAGFDHEQIRASFGIPSDYEIGAVTAIGYFGEPASLPEHLQKMEVAPRQRKPLEEFVFSEWEKPAQF